ncbi:metallophosphoesterase isoform e [Anaeramoeba ignava]|uniref:Metallophosphoesterase isoform e n=1 Tax=Anaeramoeba ignava TaxID=1746090 RepID=A0A9Q0LK21_ANAIG|nr:metallophosphoesterase isoform e [Anaeramoeba ignava]
MLTKLEAAQILSELHKSPSVQLLFPKNQYLDEKKEKTYEEIPKVLQITNGLNLEQKINIENKEKKQKAESRKKKKSEEEIEIEIQEEKEELLIKRTRTSDRTKKKSSRINQTNLSEEEKLTSRRNENTNQYISKAIRSASENNKEKVINFLNQTPKPGVSARLDFYSFLFPHFFEGWNPQTTQSGDLPLKVVIKNDLFVVLSLILDKKPKNIKRGISEFFKKRGLKNCTKYCRKSVCFMRED